MSLTKTLLASAALCALCTAPALAHGVAPSIHLGGINAAAKMTAQSGIHSKSNSANPNLPSVTQTVTFTSTLSHATSDEVATLLWADTWYSSASCTQPTKEVLTHPKKTKAARIHTGTSTGVISACGSTVFTFYGPNYTLEKPTAKKDAFQSLLVAKNFVGYNLKLVANTTVTITP